VHHPPRPRTLVKLSAANKSLCQQIIVQRYFHLAPPAATIESHDLHPPKFSAASRLVLCIFSVCLLLLLSPSPSFFAHRVSPLASRVDVYPSHINYRAVAHPPPIEFALVRKSSHAIYHLAASLNNLARADTARAHVPFGQIDSPAGDFQVFALAAKTPGTKKDLSLLYT
jgi:hypothetical protein